MKISVKEKEKGRQCLHWLMTTCLLSQNPKTCHLAMGPKLGGDITRPALPAASHTTQQRVIRQQPPLWEAGKPCQQTDTRTEKHPGSGFLPDPPEAQLLWLHVTTLNHFDQPISCVWLSLSTNRLRPAKAPIKVAQTKAGVVLTDFSSTEEFLTKPLHCPLAPKDSMTFSGPSRVLQEQEAAG